MKNYEAEIAAAKAYLESLVAESRAELAAEIAAAEELAAIESDDDADSIEADDGTNQFGFYPYINAAGQRIAFEAFADDELSPTDRLAAIRGQDGWELWRTDPDGQRWYVKSGSKPPTTIYGTPPSIGGDYD
jgi:hypothetical protein